ncbi:MAG: transcriptional regulator with XRE-family HTH domain [Enterobacterales bacterium]|jgi:transcriptional regulator with XRE-family HTH domain
MTIGKSIRLMRKSKAKQDQATFAADIGIGQAYLSRIENDRSKPTTKLIERIADHVGVPMSILFWFGAEENDVHKDKIEAFRMLKPTIDSMMNELIKEK